MTVEKNIIGYARVSTVHQDEQLQLDALKQAGCSRIFVDRASGAQRDRPELAKALDYLRPGDTFCVWKLDRLGRSVKHLITTVEGLRERQIEFRTLTEGMDTTTPQGAFIFTIFAAFAEFERELIRERVQAGLASARANGRKGGRPSTKSKKKLDQARKRLASGESAKDVAESIGVSRATLYRWLETDESAISNAT